ncbi:hypothetical protein D3C78_1625280 [compost metagenome]
MNYSMILTTAVVLGAGLLYMLLAKPYDRGNAPAGDAWKISGRQPATRATGALADPA